MTSVNANGITIEYDTFGDKHSPAILLIAGNGAQLFFWDDEFCKRLVNIGFFVIRFDNRDSGLSTKFCEAEIPDMADINKLYMAGKPIKSSYTLDDMADDCVGLLDSLKIKKAHICGASMGGMIAQVVAYRHPSRVLSLISIMSNTGNPKSKQGNPEALAAVVEAPPTERAWYIEHNIKIWRKIYSPGFKFDENKARIYLEKSYDRSYYPKGMVCQNLAILSSGDRTSFLKTIKAPTLIIHGLDDPLIPVESGKETAKAIPKAKLLIINGMGHDIPFEIYPQITDAIYNHTKNLQ